MKISKLKLWQSKLLQTVLASSLTILAASAPATATAVLFVPDGGQGSGAVSAAMPLTKLHSVNLPRGRASIKGDTITVSIIPEWQFDRVPVLNGKVLDTRIITNSGKPSLIQGVAIFTDGQWLNYIDTANTTESIITSDGKTLLARITAITNTELQAKLSSGETVQLPLAQVADIHSPRVFKFSMAINSLAATDFNSPFYLQSNTISLQSTQRSTQFAALKRTVDKQFNDGDVSTARLVFTGTTLSLLNLAQLAPLLAIPLGNAPGMRATAFRRELPYLQTISP